MRRDLRPQSAKSKLAINKQMPLSDHQPFLHTVSKQSGIATPPPKPSPTQQHALQRNQPHSLLDRNEPHSPLTLPPKEQPRMSSSSKLLKKFQDIRAYRSTKHTLEEDVAFGERQEGYLTKNDRRHRSHRKASEEVSNKLEEFPDIRPTTALNHNFTRMNRLERPSRPQSAQQVVQLATISPEDLIFEKGGAQDRTTDAAEEGLIKLEDKSRTAYWKSQNKFVSLFLLEKNENLSYQHDHILPIYAQVEMEGSRYVVSDEYKNCSLAHLIQEFGPFPEALARRYLKQIALGVHHLHYNKKSHNQLSTGTILYNKQGNLFINMMKAASIYRKKEDLINRQTVYWHSPEFLSPKKSKTFKNDVWAVGCLALQMLTGSQLADSPLHPYNFLNFNSSREQTMIDNLKQRYPSYFQDKHLPQAHDNFSKRTLSQQAVSFIRLCLQVLDERRPEMEALLEHQFFQRK